MSEEVQKSSIEKILDAANVLADIAAATKPDCSNEGIMASCAALETAIRAVEFAKQFSNPSSPYDKGDLIYRRIWGDKPKD